jgi:hypothetical protein
MQALRAFAGIALVALAGCSTPSDVVKLSGDTYRVRPEAGGGSPTDAEIKARGIQRATEYCEAQGKHAVITVGQTSSWFVFSLQTAEVRFYCEERRATQSAAKAASAP